MSFEIKFMRCEKCQAHEANVFLTEISNDEQRKLSLCEKCAEALGLGPKGLNFAKLLAHGAALAAASADSQPAVCPACGFTEERLRKTGLFGCPQCYETFTELVAEAVRDMQRGPRHTGKVPGQRAAGRQQLEQELTAAVAQENYELAAQLRDRLRDLKT